METGTSNKTFRVSGNTADSPCAEQQYSQKYQTSEIKADSYMPEEPHQSDNKHTPNGLHFFQFALQIASPANFFEEGIEDKT